MPPLHHAQPARMPPVHCVQLASADGDAQPLLFSRSLSLSDSLPPLFCTRTHTHTAHTRTHNCPALSPLLHSSLFRRVSQRHCVQTAPAGMCERRAPTHPVVLNQSDVKVVAAAREQLTAFLGDKAGDSDK